MAIQSPIGGSNVKKPSNQRAKARRIRMRGNMNLGSANVKKKRSFYKRWSRMTPSARSAARFAGKQQFVPRPSLD